MKLVTWNVNGMRAIARKGFLDWLYASDVDVVALQETKARPDQLEPEIESPEGYRSQWFSAERAGYSGVGTLSKKRPVRVECGFGEERFDCEGRVLATRHRGFTLVNVYFPNGKKDDTRLRYKLDFYEALRAWLRPRVEDGEDFVVCGDWNTAHREIDLARPKENRKISGFMDIERAAVDAWIDEGWIDAFRELYPEQREAYSWWSLRSGARARNVGWRIDYHLVTPGLRKKLRSCEIQTEVMGSDHCPVLLELA